LLCVAGLFSFDFNKLESDAYTSTVTNQIANLYNDTDDEFNTQNLNALAAAAGYTGNNSFSAMVSAVEASSNPSTPIKKATDFGMTTIKFGSFTYNGSKHDL